jgi:NADH-quinone oxidoreductase subunit J
MEALIFYVLAAITLVSAFLVVLLRRPLHNVLFMITTMIGLAGLFVLLHAEFVGMVQLVVYAGAVMVLFLFVIMLLNVDRVVMPSDPRDARWWGGGLAAACVAATALQAISAYVPPKPSVTGSGTLSNTEAIGKELFTTYLLPFEIASVLLLAAMIGAVLLVRKRS